MNSADQKRKENELSKYIINPNVLREIIKGVSDYKSDERKKSYVHNKLITKFGEDYKNLVDCRGDTLVHVGASLGYFDLCKFIIDSGFDINKRGDMGATPLHELVYAYQTHILGEGLGENDDPNAEYLRLLQFFLEKGANINLDDSYGYSVVDIMVVHDNFDMMDKVFESGVTFARNAKKRYNASSSDQEVLQSSSEASSEHVVSQSSPEESNISLEGMINTEIANTKKFRMTHIQHVAEICVLMGACGRELDQSRLKSNQKPVAVEIAKLCSNIRNNQASPSDLLNVLFLNALKEMMKDKQNLSKEEFVDPEIIVVSAEGHANSQTSYHSKK